MYSINHAMKKSLAVSSAVFTLLCRQHDVRLCSTHSDTR